LYRLEDSEEVEYLGWQEYLNSDDVCIVEWAEKARDIWPENRYELYFEYDSDFVKRFVEVK
jgi:tRNA threonylcarbamoyladenosine biosynthesis protein TsaE